jgi:hypothetical protein
MCGVWVFASLAAASPSVTAVGHEGRVTEDGIGWETQLLVSSWGQADALTVELAAPLSEDIELMGSDFGRVQPLRDGQGRVTGLALSELEARPTRVRIWTFQPHAEDQLSPPLIAGSLQRVELDGAFFEADPDLGIHRHLRFQAQSDLSPAERRGLDRQLDGRHRRGPGRQPIYVEGDARVSQGLLGQLRPQGERSLGLGLFVAGLFGGVILLLLMAHKLLVKMEAASDAARRSEAA